MKSRFFRAAAVLTAALACAPAIGQVTTYPLKPVRLVIPFTPGGAVDVLARAMGNELTKLWGQAVLIESKPGAGGIIAAAAVAHSAPDGYTIFMTDQTPLAISPFLQRDLPFDPVNDFAAVIALVNSSGVVVVPNNSPLNTIRDLIAAAKAKPGAINFGSWGIGSTPHLDPEELAAMAGINMTHIPYKGAVGMFQGLLSGDIQFAFISIGAAMPQLKQGGRLKGIAYGALERSPLLPDVPTIAESGLPGFQASSWLGWIVPAATPRTIIHKIAADAGRVLSVQAFKDKYIDAVGFEVSNVPAEAFAQLIIETRAKREAQLKRLKLSVN